jgi:hypothetical protein
MSDGYTPTPATRRSLAGFRRTLPKATGPDAEGGLPLCPPDCTTDHDADKTPGRDHWTPRKAPKARR